MGNEMLQIADFVGKAFLRIWPYLVVTIPLAVAVNLSGASRYIKRAFAAGPVAAIFLATAVGAFSPFCSCTVVPVVAALLIGGVPLAPVMSFWVASPSMDPEIFFLSVGTIGWDLALWRLGGTLLLSLAAGFISHLAVVNGWLGDRVLRPQNVSRRRSPAAWFRGACQSAAARLKQRLAPGRLGMVPAPAAACCQARSAVAAPNRSAASGPADAPAAGHRPAVPAAESSGGDNESFFRRLIRESVDATLMVLKFMALAFFLEALIVLYLPPEWIAGMVGRGNDWAILTAALLGVPVYTSNLTALPMVGGLLIQGMSPAAALAFLVAGPTTTLPAMAAVWSLVSRRVFALYVSFALLGAIALGVIKQFTI